MAYYRGQLLNAHDFPNMVYLHRPGIEPGPHTWQAMNLPLNQRCINQVTDVNIGYTNIISHLFTT